MSSMTLTNILHKDININDKNLIYTVVVAFLCPTIWNILARICNKITTNQSKTFQYITCYILAIWIFSFSSYRDYCFSQMLTTQPHTLNNYIHNYISYDIQQYIGIGLILIGQIFVLSSFYQLGITGTFLGDYCGILMQYRVITFPFNVLNDPMYDGATLSFLGYSLYNNSITGLIVTLWIYILYQIALKLEGPYTDWIYSEAANKKKQTKAQ